MVLSIVYVPYIQVNEAVMLPTLKTREIVSQTDFLSLCSVSFSGPWVSIYFSKSTIETPENVQNLIEVNNNIKDIKTT